MDEMKFDMSGAAAVLGDAARVAELALPINVVAIVRRLREHAGRQAP